ncbi:MAG TPA: hypothetical protein VN963_00980, partial [bacterium]|nr:hypothetical protein [bacterium]
MKTSRQSPLVKSLLVSILLIIAQIAFADNTATPASAPVNSSSTLIVHKPAPDPSWGKVIQYQEEQSVSSVDQTHETLYKFLFQDSNGIVRVAIYHE